MYYLAISTLWTHTTYELSKWPHNHWTELIRKLIGWFVNKVFLSLFWNFQLKLTHKKTNKLQHSVNLKLYPKFIIVFWRQVFHCLSWQICTIKPFQLMKYKSKNCSELNSYIVLFFGSVILQKKSSSKTKIIVF